MNVAFQRNVGSFIRSVAAFAASAITTSNDGTPVNGLTIDREQFSSLALSASVAVLFTLTAIGTTETLEVRLTAQDSADGTNWKDLDLGVPDGVRAHVYGASYKDKPTVAQFKAQLAAARRYVRFRVTPTLSASSADTVSILGGVAVIAGFDELPPEAHTEHAASS